MQILLFPSSTGTLVVNVVIHSASKTHTAQQSVLSLLILNITIHPFRLILQIYSTQTMKLSFSFFNFIFLNVSALQTITTHPLLPSRVTWFSGYKNQKSPILHSWLSCFWDPTEGKILIPSQLEGMRFHPSDTILP